MNSNMRFLLSMEMEIDAILKLHKFKDLVYGEHDGYFTWRTADGKGTVEYVRLGLRRPTGINSREVRNSFIIMTEVGV